MKRQHLLPLLLVLFLTSCTEGPDSARIVNMFLQKDSTPPSLVSVSCTDDHTVRLSFSEPVMVYGYCLEQYQYFCDGVDLNVDLGTSLKPGESSVLEGRVCDAWGNTTGFSTLVWGWNPNPAEAVISELTVNSGSSLKSPDRTELLVLSSGNLAGMTLYDGIPDDWEARCVLPDIEARKGSCVVIWWCLSLPDDVEEHPDRYIWNICARTASNPSSNNGVQTLAMSPAEGASVLDAVVYSSHTQATDFGSAKVQDRVKWLCSKGYWKGSGDFSALWGADSAGSSATSSIARYGGVDTNTPEDWHVTGKNGSTFGYENPSD